MNTQYALSDQNWLTALGCEDIVAGVGVNNEIFAGGCVSICGNSERGGLGVCPNIDDENEYSAGNGCCRTPLPKGTTLLGAKLNDLSGRWELNKTFPCSYAFVEEKGLNNQCHCMKGYHGNPYLDNGCEDVNECDDEKRNPCDIDSNSICTNTIGSVNCSCPKGYHGDGRKNGKGCIPSTSNTSDILIGVGVGIGSILFFSTCIYLHKFIQKKRNEVQKENFFKRNGGLIFKQRINGDTIQKTEHFSAEELEKATDNFNRSRILGQGAQGTVYKGMLSDGKIVAIKKSKVVSEVNLELFINEVVIVSKITHKNVVKLWGCCLETEVPLLVYELVPNGTLLDLIHDPSTEFQFSWNMRLKIASDVAAAVAYLHDALTIPIYHRDIKSSNILLDEKYVVKLSDFGISRSVATNQTHLTTQVLGTFGYFDPEYFLLSQYTEKSDVYSFGVVLVELLTGQRVIPLNVDETSLVARFLESMKENKFYTMLDPRVSKDEDYEEVIAVAWIARRCLNLSGEMRPTMKEVVTLLESLRLCEESRVCDETMSTFSDIEDARTSGGIIEESSSNVEC